MSNNEAPQYFLKLDGEEEFRPLYPVEQKPETLEEAVANLTKAIDELKQAFLDEADRAFHLEVTLRKLSKILNKLLKEGK